ncbi:MAG TPA: hypothetical protein VMX17_02015 [Candidatus Glassbacteria bacterium]|nr:hypothetical protein [Candidatus Glassbacteria bacterium]
MSDVMNTQEALGCIDDSIEMMKMVDKECEKVQDSIIPNPSDEQRNVVAMLMRNQAAVANIIFGIMETILTNQDNLRKKLDSLNRKRK